MNTLADIPDFFSLDEDTRGKVLRNAHYALLIRSPKTDAASKLEEDLATETEKAEFALGRKVRKRQARFQKTFKSTISAFVADLILASGNQGALGFCYRNKDREEFKFTLAEDRQFNTIEDVWQRLGWLEIVKGIRVNDDWLDGQHILHDYASRYRATPELLSIASALDITSETVTDHYDDDRTRLQSITFRARKTKGKGKKSYRSGKRMKVPQTNRTKHLIEEMSEINRFIEGYEFNLPEPPYLRRIFNNGDDPKYMWDQGGRMYPLGAGGYQQLDKAERSKITINCEPVTEVDIRASHLTILYAKAGKSLGEGDPYRTGDLATIRRDVVKSLVTVILGKGDYPNQWNQDLRANYLAEKGRNINDDYPLRKTAQRILDVHPLIEMLQETGLDTFQLQYLEAEVLKNTMLRFIRHFETPSLPVHDSLIVRQRDKDLAKDILADVFLEEIGVEPEITIK